MADLVDALSATGKSARRPADSLTPRQLLIIASVVEGASNKAIAAALQSSGDMSAEMMEKKTKEVADAQEANAARASGRAGADAPCCHASQ